MNDRFCVFILSHGRARKVKTLNTLERDGYTGDWYIVIDDEDAQAALYREVYGPDRVIVFSKQEVAQTFDQADLSEDRRAVVYARNACFQIARSMGYDTFLQLDDDYGSFQFRYQEGRKLKVQECTDLDRLFAAMLQFLSDTNAASVALAQGGDNLGGVQSGSWKLKVMRKAMNTFFIRTDADWRFVGRINEDVNTYTVLGTRGYLFFSTAEAMVTQSRTQATAGGMTGLYLDSGTYLKSFYPVMMCPSAVQIRMMRSDHPRIHHGMKWRNCTPKILSETYRKPSALTHA